MTEAVGLDFVHDPGPTGTYLMPQSMGSGAAFFDFDGDGLLDIYLIHHGGPGGKKNFAFKCPGIVLGVSARLVAESCSLRRCGDDRHG